MRLVRPATLNDLPNLSNLWHEKMLLQQQSDSRFKLMVGAKTEWVKAAALWLVDERCRILILEEDTVLSGYIIGWIQNSPPGLLPEKIGAVTDLMIDAHSQKGGVGTQLFDALRKWFTDQGIQQMIACTPARLAVEQAFWRARGATERTNILWLK